MNQISIASEDSNVVSLSSWRESVPVSGATSPAIATSVGSFAAVSGMAYAAAAAMATEPVPQLGQAAALEFGALGANGGVREMPEKQGAIAMDDKDVHRLEDRIAASEERAQLRLETAMAKIEGAVDRISDQTGGIREELRRQHDERLVQQQELRTEATETRAAQRAWSQWILGTVLFAALGLAGLFIGLGQFWADGVEYGQATHPVVQAPAAQVPAAKPPKASHAGGG